MDYRGYKIKETTAIGAFDTPRKMLVWGERIGLRLRRRLKKLR